MKVDWSQILGICHMMVTAHKGNDVSISITALFGWVFGPLGWINKCFMDLSLAFTY